MKKIFGYVFLAAMIVIMSGTGEVMAAEEAEENTDYYGEILDLYDFADIDKELEDKAVDYSFSDIVEVLIKGDFKPAVTMIREIIQSRFFYEILYHKNALIKIILLAVISAMFSNISVILNKTEISETGFYITYILMITILISSFQIMSGVLYDVTEEVTSFIQIMIPSLVLSVGLCCGQATALGFGEIALFVIYIGEMLIKNIVLPMIKLYVIIMAVNHLLTEDYLSKFGEIFKGFVLWFLKFFTGVVMGINIIKGMILPGIDLAGKNTAVKLMNLIPGAQELTAAGSIFLSSASVIKNAIGGAAIIILVIITIVPAVKMLVFVAAYKITAALIQPVADRRIAKCVDSAADGVMLLNKVLMTQVIMLSLSLAVLCMVTT